MKSAAYLFDIPENSSSQLKTEEESSNYTVLVVVFLALHIPLALLMQRFPFISALHAWSCLALGLLWMLKDRQPYRVIYITSYILGAEILWRATKAPIFWEFGKYATGLLLFLSILRYGKLEKANKLPSLYFILLLPAIFLMASLDRQIISFNLSGPFALMAATMFFSTVRLTPKHIRSILLALLAPTIGITFLASWGILTAEKIAFSLNSLDDAAAGFGANQVSSMLGLGLLAAFLYIFYNRSSHLLNFIMIGIMLWTGVQSALTFSRGGLWGAFGAVAVAAFFLVRDSRQRTLFLFVGVLFYLLVSIVVFPVLDQFTEGNLARRFQDLDTTGRIEIIQADLQAYRENPVFGLGVGESKNYHALVFRYASAHTEYSRMLAEHGSLGLLGLMIWVILVFNRWRRSPLPIDKAFVMSLTAWALLYMFHAAMRLAAPAFIFGLAEASFVDEIQPEEEEGMERLSPSWPNQF